MSDPLLRAVRVPILSGVNRGRWWSLVSAGSGYGSGRRASAQMETLAALVRPGDVVWDVGAQHGFATLCAAQRVGPRGAVHAFEPSARNRVVLRQHVSWNGFDNVTVHPYALSDHDGATRFGGTGTSKTYALGGGTEMVQVRTGITLVASAVCPPPSFVKLDVEGAEADALAGAIGLLPRSARLLIAVHGREVDARCTALLEAAGFHLLPSRELEACRRGAWRADPDLLAIGPGDRDGERVIASLRAASF